MPDEIIYDVSIYHPATFPIIKQIVTRPVKKYKLKR